MAREYIEVCGAKANNLKNIDIDIPRNEFVVVTGLSGSGKSSLVSETLMPILKEKFYRSKERPLPYDAVEGLQHIDKLIEMNFLPSVHVPCDECRGRRYKEDTLAVRYKGKNINNVLEMPVAEAYEFFKPIPKIAVKLKSMVDVGLGYILDEPTTVLIIEHNSTSSNPWITCSTWARKGEGTAVISSSRARQRNSPRPRIRYRTISESLL